VLVAFVALLTVGALILLAGHQTGYFVVYTVILCGELVLICYITGGTAELALGKEMTTASARANSLRLPLSPSSTHTSATGWWEPTPWQGAACEALQKQRVGERFSFEEPCARSKTGGPPGYDQGFPGRAD
jgi:hypothetical protein